MSQAETALLGQAKAIITASQGVKEDRGMPKRHRACVNAGDCSPGGVTLLRISSSLAATHQL